jgi:hypothetical protein
MNNPKFNKHIDNQIKAKQQTQSSGRHGIILTYNAVQNTATIGLSAPDSDVLIDLLRNVPCPTQIGVQTVAPEPGRPCWVAFKGNKDNNNAVVSHYFNHMYNSFDYPKQSGAATGVPSFLTRM